MNVQLEQYVWRHTLTRGREMARFVQKNSAGLGSSYPETVSQYESGFIRGLGVYARQAAARYQVPDLATGGEEFPAIAFGIRADNRLIGAAHIVRRLRVQGMGDDDHGAVTSGTYVDYYVQPDDYANDHYVHDTVGDLLLGQVKAMGPRPINTILVDMQAMDTFGRRAEERPIMTFARVQDGVLNPRGIMNYLEPVNEPQPYAIHYFDSSYPVKGGAELQLYWGDGTPS